MNLLSSKPGMALHGKTLLLSASVPAPNRAERYNRIENAAFEIEQAIISLARATLSEGGRLVFGGHPAISPLVAMVVGEYREPRFVETSEDRRRPPVDIYQSRAYEGYLPDETLWMFRLGYASIHWVDAVDNERFDPQAPSGVLQCKRSLQKMRQNMLETSTPDAMVCIGGMEGLEDEVSLALEMRARRFQIYVLEKTGGAAALLRERYSGRVRMIDTEVIERIDRFKKQMRAAQPENESAVSLAAVPYPLVMQTIVQEIAEKR